MSVADVCPAMILPPLSHWKVVACVVPTTRVTLLPEQAVSVVGGWAVTDGGAATTTAEAVAEHAPDVAVTEYVPAAFATAELDTTLLALADQV